LYLQTRLGADTFEHAPALADQNSLLSLAFTIDCGRDASEFLTFFELINAYGHRVRDFFTGFKEHLFADRLRDHETHGLIGNLVRGEVVRSRRQRFDQL